MAYTRWCCARRGASVSNECAVAPSPGTSSSGEPVPPKSSTLEADARIDRDELRFVRRRVAPARGLQPIGRRSSREAGTSRASAAQQSVRGRSGVPSGQQAVHAITSTLFIVDSRADDTVSFTGRAINQRSQAAR